MPTQFGRAMKELGAELICARGPQPKGRVERRSAVLQDRRVGSGHGALNLPRRRVRVKQLGDRRLLLEYQGQRLKFTELSARPAPTKPKKAIVNNRRYKPAAAHPWNPRPGGRAASGSG